MLNNSTFLAGFVMHNMPKGPGGGVEEHKVYMTRWTIYYVLKILSILRCTAQDKISYAIFAIFLSKPNHIHRTSFYMKPMYIGTYLNKIQIRVHSYINGYF